MLLLNKNGLLLESFEKEYREAVGKAVPYRALGFATSQELLESMPEVVALQEVPGGHVLLVAVPDERTEHMARMVGSQRETQGGYNYRTGQVVASMGHQVRRQVQKVVGRRSRAVPAFLKEQVEQLVGLEEHREGLDKLAFLQAYHQLFDYQLEFHSYGFHDLLDFLHHGVGEVVTLVPGQAGWVVFPRSPTSHSPNEVPEEVRRKVAVLLSTRPSGLEVSALPLVSTALGPALEATSLGFPSLEELCLAMPDICTFTAATRDAEATILPLTPSSLAHRRVAEPSHIASNSERGEEVRRCEEELEVSTITEGCWVEVVAVEASVATVVQVERWEELWGLEDRMEEHYTEHTGSLGTEVVAGRLVAFLHPCSAVWRRGRVVGVRGEEVEVEGLDCGTLVRLPAKVLRRLAQQFRRLPALATRAEVEESALGAAKVGGVVWAQPGREGGVVIGGKVKTWCGVEVPRVVEEVVARDLLLATIAAAWR